MKITFLNDNWFSSISIRKISMKAFSVRKFPLLWGYSRTGPIIPITDQVSLIFSLFRKSCKTIEENWFNFRLAKQMHKKHDQILCCKTISMQEHELTALRWSIDWMTSIFINKCWPGTKLCIQKPLKQWNLQVSSKYKTHFCSLSSHYCALITKLRGPHSRLPCYSIEQ